jgi:hypothetical protein
VVFELSVKSILDLKFWFIFTFWLKVASQYYDIVLKKYTARLPPKDFFLRQEIKKEEKKSFCFSSKKISSAKNIAQQNKHTTHYNCSNQKKWFHFIK